MSEWISVEDRLPEQCEDVFVQLENNTILVAYLNTNGTWVQLDNGKPFYSRWGIKRWFRPEPPKPEGPFVYCWQPENNVCGIYYSEDAPLPMSYWPIAFDNEIEGKRAVEYLNAMWAKHMP